MASERLINARCQAVRIRLGDVAGLITQAPPSEPLRNASARINELGFWLMAAVTEAPDLDWTEFDKLYCKDEGPGVHQAGDGVPEATPEQLGEHIGGKPDLTPHQQSAQTQSDRDNRVGDRERAASGR